MAEGGDSIEGGAARVLSQNEIDSLLGFGGATQSQENSGIMALINSALVNYERLPMLEVVFDRLVRMMSTSLRNFTSDNVEVSLDQITSVRFGDYLNSIPLPAMLAVFKAEEWDNSALMTIDSAMIYDHKAQRAHTLAKYTHSITDPSKWAWGVEGWLDTGGRFETLYRQLGVCLTDGSGLSAPRKMKGKPNTLLIWLV